MEAIPDSDDLETSSLRAAISPRAAKVAGARKSQRRSSRFVQDLEVDNPRVGSRSDLNTDTPRTGRHVARNPSSITFPPAMSESRDNLLQDSIDSLHMDWKLDSPRKTASPRKRGAQIDSAASRRKSSRLSTVMDTAMDAANALGKRSRDAFEQGVEKIRTIQRRKNAGQRLTEGERLLLEEHTKKREMDEHRENTTLRLRPGKNLKDLPPLPKGWSYNVPEDEMPAAKRAKVVEENKKKNQVADSEDEDEAKLNKAIAPQPRRKKWLTQGLYVGQKRGYDPRLKPAQNHKKQAGRLTKGLEEENSILPLPMFAGEALLERGRNFKLPFDIFCPLPVGQPKPEEWKKIRTSMLIFSFPETAITTLSHVLLTTSLQIAFSVMPAFTGPSKQPFHNHGVIVIKLTEIVAIIASIARFRMNAMPAIVILVLKDVQIEHLLASRNAIRSRLSLILGLKSR